jgi:hypothetical protein
MKLACVSVCRRKASGCSAPTWMASNSKTIAGSAQMKAKGEGEGEKEEKEAEPCTPP